MGFTDLEIQLRVHIVEESLAALIRRVEMGERAVSRHVETGDKRIDELEGRIRDYWKARVLATKQWNELHGRDADGHRQPKPPDAKSESPPDAKPESLLERAERFIKEPKELVRTTEVRYAEVLIEALAAEVERLQAVANDTPAPQPKAPDAKPFCSLLSSYSVCLRNMDEGVERLRSKIESHRGYEAPNVAFTPTSVLLDMDAIFGPPKGE